MTTLIQMRSIPVSLLFTVPDLFPFGITVATTSFVSSLTFIRTAGVSRRRREPNDPMKESPITLTNFDRLAKGIMERRQVNYAEARKMLSDLQLGLIAGEDIRDSRAHQAALLTAINTGKRAFRGGVAVSLRSEEHTSELQS